MDRDKGIGQQKLENSYYKFVQGFQGKHELNEQQIENLNREMETIKETHVDTLELKTTYVK